MTDVLEPSANPLTGDFAPDATTLRGLALIPGRGETPARQPRRLPHDRGRGGGAVRRQGALAEEAGRPLRPGPVPLPAHRPHGGPDPLDGVHHHRDRGPGAAARIQPDQAAEAPLQRGAARRQELRGDPAAARPPRAPGAQAPRRPHHQGRLLRPLRQHLGGEPHGQHPAEGLPAALLLRQRLRQPHPPLPAAPDQALLGALHRPDQRGATMRSWPTRRTSSSAASRAPCCSACPPT